MAPSALGRIASSLAPSDSAVSLAWSLTSRSLVPRILTVMFASFLTIRWSVVLSVMPSSTTVLESSKVRPSTLTMERSFIVSGACKSLGPPRSFERIRLDHKLLEVRDRVVLVQRQPVLALVHHAVIVDRSGGFDADVLHVAQAHHEVAVGGRRALLLHLILRGVGFELLELVNLGELRGRGVGRQEQLAGDESAAQTLHQRLAALAPDIQSGLSFSVRLVTTWFLRTSTGLELPLARSTRMSVARAGRRSRARRAVTSASRSRRRPRRPESQSRPSSRPSSSATAPCRAWSR